VGPGVTDQGPSRLEGQLGGSFISLADATGHDWTSDNLLTRLVAVKPSIATT
jgi:hypothetical protein